ncbi:centrosomal protein of 70 kDa isoform X2 [Oryzias latipes]|uniref:centrosomal protein of 70 kDa isoform X2 n=1 Tax=Oryzias latipes TaxID=8090 RepID=UPI000CE19F81|nr:centrosomal protein of 70 kDa isoform X2 [Oryzias latipes]
MRPPGGNGTFVYLWTCRQFQEQQAEWEPLNRLLQQRGFRPVLFADPVENKNPAELGLLDRKSAAALRRTLETLLADSDRRQALLQELVGSNNRLREEVQEQMSRAAQHSQRASELQALLDQVKVKVQDLEDRCICRAAQTHSRTLQLQRHSAEAIRRCEQLQQKLRRKEEEAAKLRWKLRFAVEQEERRLARRNRSFQEICGKTSRLQTAADQRVLDVIDFYEAERRRLMEELRSARGGAEASELQDGGERTAAGAPSSFKTDLKVFPQKERRTQLEAELDSRPTREQPKGRRRRHLEGLQPGAARLTTVGGAKTKGVEEPPREVWLCAQFRTLLSDIRAVIGSPASSKEAESELADFQALLPVLEDWAGQRRLLKDLRDLLVDLSGGPREDSAAAVKVEDLIVLVEDMLENASKDPEQLRNSAPYTLSAIVSHFQKLFDVPSLRGVYPRMNEVYTRLAEMTNAMRNLKDALDLDGRASPAEVVNHVSALASAQQSGLRDLLEEADIDSVILKVKQHDEFLPAFHRLITDILQTLGVTHLEEILPALKSLQRSAA